MNAIEIIRTIMGIQGVGNSKLADRLNMKPNAINMRLNADRDITSSKLAETLRALDYRIVIMPRDVKLPKDSYEVE